MEAQKDLYYRSLKQAQRNLEPSNWIQYFSKTVLHAQEEAKKLILFSLQKTKFFDRFRDQLNERQTKVINRILEEGPSGFEVCMSAKKYMAIAKISKAIATRDLRTLA